METIDTSALSPNPWNTNELTPEAERKLDESIRRNGMFKPIIVRERADGKLEIVGGIIVGKAASVLASRKCLFTI